MIFNYNNFYLNKNLGEYKSYVSNKTHPEGSIAEAYIVNKLLTFCLMYLQQTEKILNRTEHYDDGGERVKGIPVFSQNARPF